MLDEGCDLSSFPPVLNVPRSVFATLPKYRNPFQSLEHFPASTPMSKKMKGSVIQVATNSIRRDSGQFPLLINESPIGHSCIKKKPGPTDFNQLPINLAAVNLSSERKKGKSPLITIMQNYEISSKVIKDYSFSSNQWQLPILASTNPSPSVSGFCNKTNPSQGDKALQVHASKILKHYSRKHTSFNNLWTALLKSELNGGCDIKLPFSAPSRKHKSKPSIFANNLDLLEVCNSRIQTSNCLSRSVNSGSPVKHFKYSKLPIFNPKVNLLRGFPCRADIDKLTSKTLESPFRVSSEGSLAFPNSFDFKNNEEVEGADHSSLFDEASVVPIKVPSELPKDLLPLVNDCGIILV